jgi:hypothetical protein
MSHLVFSLMIESVTVLCYPFVRASMKYRLDLGIFNKVKGMKLFYYKSRS